MSLEMVRLALGAFLTSPGAGILGLLGAAYLTYKGVDKRLSGDRDLAKDAREAEAQKDRESDARDRWQKFHDHLWENRAALPADLRRSLSRSAPGRPWRPCPGPCPRSAR